jgi:hypothetical protein
LFLTNVVIFNTSRSYRKTCFNFNICHEFVFVFTSIPSYSCGLKKVTKYFRWQNSQRQLLEIYFILSIYGMFINVISRSRYTASNGMMVPNNELERAQKEAVVPSTEMLYSYRHLLQGQRRTTNILNKINWSPVQDLNPRPSEQETGVLPTLPWLRSEF